MEKEGAKEITVAGLVLVARDTGRVLMLQRAVDDDDPAQVSGSFRGAISKKVSLRLKGLYVSGRKRPGVSYLPAKSRSRVPPNGIYQLFVYLVESENVLVINNDEEARPVDNPDVEWVEE